MVEVVVIILKWMWLYFGNGRGCDNHLEMVGAMVGREKKKLAKNGFRIDFHNLN